MKTLTCTLLALLVGIQVAVIAQMIGRNERILREGEAFRFKTRPIDPSDPFQGRYIRLQFEQDHLSFADGALSDVPDQSTLYVRITTNETGFACFDGGSVERPTSGVYLKVRTSAHYTWNPKSMQSLRDGLRVELPFDRFYMDEHKAPHAETLVRDAARETNCWASVRILNGKAAIENVYVQGHPIGEAVGNGARPKDTPKE